MRLCPICGYCHTTPTGKNCPVGALPQKENTWDFAQFPADSTHFSEVHGVAPAASSHGQKLERMEKDFNSRLDKLESLFINSLEHKQSAVRSDYKYPSPLLESTHDSLPISSLINSLFPPLFYPSQSFPLPLPFPLPFYLFFSSILSPFPPLPTPLFPLLRTAALYFLHTT